MCARNLISGGKNFQPDYKIHYMWLWNRTSYNFLLLFLSYDDATPPVIVQYVCHTPIYMPVKAGLEVNASKGNERMAGPATVLSVVTPAAVAEVETRTYDIP
jgi:hypothetical protein